MKSIEQIEHEYSQYTEPVLLIGSIVVIIIYYLVFSSLGNNDSGTASPIKIFIEHTLWFIFIVLLLLNGITYIFHVDLIKVFKNFIYTKKHDDVANGATQQGIIPDDKHDEEDEHKFNLFNQVFNLSEKNYSFDDAKAVCTAYDAKLATYDELNSAYNKGADWCNPSWTDGQMALYPTQKASWEILQKSKGHEHDCGHPGINGIYIPDPNKKFGVNCYGPKPHVTPDQVHDMINTPIYKKNSKELAFDKSVDFWRTKISQIVVAPFNHNNWSIL